MPRGRLRPLAIVAVLAASCSASSAPTPEAAGTTPPTTVAPTATPRVRRRWLRRRRIRDRSGRRRNVSCGGPGGHGAVGDGHADGRGCPGTRGAGVRGGPHWRRHAPRRRPGRRGRPVLVLGPHLSDMSQRGLGGRRAQPPTGHHGYRPVCHRPGRRPGAVSVHPPGVGHRRVPAHRRRRAGRGPLRHLRYSGHDRGHRGRLGGLPYRRPGAGRLRRPDRGRTGHGCLTAAGAGILGGWPRILTRPYSLEEPRCPGRP